MPESTFWSKHNIIPIGIDGFGKPGVDEELL